MFISFQSDFIGLYMAHILPDKFRNKNNARKILNPPPSSKYASKDNGGKLLAFVRLDIHLSICVCVCVCVFCVLQLFYLGKIISTDYD